MTKLHTSGTARIEGHIDVDRLQSLRRSYRASRLTRYVIRPLLMAIMVAALLTGILSVIVEVNRDTRWFALILLFFLIALEAIYTTNWLHHPRQMPLDRNRYRGAELLLLFVVVRIASWIVFAEGIPDSAELEQYLRSPHTLFLNVPFLITLLLAAITWRLAVLLAQIFNQLEVSDHELHFHSLPAAERKARVEDRPIQTGRVELVKDYTRYWLWGGILLAFAVGVSTLEQQSAETIMGPLAAGRADVAPRLLGALLLYLIIGLWLLSQARLMHMNSRWLLNNVARDENTQRNWQRASLLLIVLVATVATFLPIGSTSALGELVGLLIYGLLILANAIIFLLTLPFALLLMLFAGETPQEFAPPPLMQDPRIPTPAEFEPPAYLETVKMVLSSGFWAVFLVLVILALLFFLRERRGGEGGQAGPRLWDQIAAWLQDLWARVLGGARALQDSLMLALARPPEEASGETAESPSRWRFLRVSGLPPREQIRYFYLSAARRAGDQGVKRAPANTPLEYKQDLKENWPEADEALEELTDAFLKARYSNQPFTSEDVPAVKETWKEVRRELRHGPTPEADQDSSDKKQT